MRDVVARPKVEMEASAFRLESLNDSLLWFVGGRWGFTFNPCTTWSKVIANMHSSGVDGRLQCIFTSLWFR